MFFLKDLPSRRMVEGYAARFDDVDPDNVLAALAHMRSASLLIRSLEVYFAEHDLSQLRFLTLILIDREPERTNLTVGEIADRLDVSRPVVTRTLKSLQQSALIAIASDERDGRSKRVSLTRTGIAKLQALLPGYFAILHGQDTVAGGWRSD